MKASICTYPWDLVDEGVDNALDNIQHIAGLNDVVLALSYHISTYFLPHNPKRQIYYGEDGMILFKPERARYGETQIQPRVSEVVEDGDYLKRLTDRIAERGLSLTPWVVYSYNHHLARAYPECARQDALGNRHLSQLSVSHPDVRAYFMALTEDIMEQCRPQAVLLESLSFRQFEYGLLNPKISAAITPWCRFLLGLCMSDQSMEAATRAGLDGESFRAEVASYLREQLTRIPEGEEIEAPVSEERIETAFDGQLARFIDSRVEVASSLMEEVVARIRSYGDVEVLLFPGFSSSSPDPVSGLSPERLAGLLDYQYVPPTLEDVETFTRASDLKLLLNTRPTQFSSADDMKSTVGACLENGAQGISIYNYGLVQIEHLRWVGQMRDLWEVP